VKRSRFRAFAVTATTATLLTLGIFPAQAAATSRDFYYAAVGNFGSVEGPIEVDNPAASLDNDSELRVSWNLTFTSFGDPCVYTKVEVERYFDVDSELTSDQKACGKGTSKSWNAESLTTTDTPFKGIKKVTVLICRQDLNRDFCEDASVIEDS